MRRDQAIDQQRRQPLRRSRSDRVLGGICAGIAATLGLDPLLVRVATVVLTLITGGAAAVAYLLAWALLPESSDRPDTARLPPAAPSGATDLRGPWNAAAGQLRALAVELRPSTKAFNADQTRIAAQVTDPAPTARGNSRPPMDALDAAIIDLDRRLRDPEVQACARRAAAGLSLALGTSVQELLRRVRGKAPPDPGR